MTATTSLSPGDSADRRMAGAAMAARPAVAVWLRKLRRFMEGFISKPDDGRRSGVQFSDGPDPEDKRRGSLRLHLQGSERRNAVMKVYRTVWLTLFLMTLPS